MKKDKIPYDHLDDAYSNAASSTECTGLITCVPLSEEEYLAYYDIYDFAPPPAGEMNVFAHGKKD